MYRKIIAIGFVNTSSHCDFNKTSYDHLPIIFQGRDALATKERLNRLKKDSTNKAPQA